MPLFVLEIDEISRAGLRAVSDLRAALQEAFYVEKKSRKLTQQDIANQLNVHRSVINRQLTGEENLTVRKAAEIARAMGWEARFTIRKPEIDCNQNEPLGSSVLHWKLHEPIGTGIGSHFPVIIPSNYIVPAIVETSKTEKISAE